MCVCPSLTFLQYLNPRSRKDQSLNDASDYKTLVSSMDKIGLTDEERGNLLRLTAAILHLGNTTFDELTKDAKGLYVHIHPHKCSCYRSGYTHAPMYMLQIIIHTCTYMHATDQDTRMHLCMYMHATLLDTCMYSTPLRNEHGIKAPTCMLYVDQDCHMHLCTYMHATLLDTRMYSTPLRNEHGVEDFRPILCLGLQAASPGGAGAPESPGVQSDGHCQRRDGRDHYQVSYVIQYWCWCVNVVWDRPQWWM